MAFTYNHRGDKFVFQNYLTRRKREFLYVEIAGYTAPKPAYKITRQQSYSDEYQYVLEYVLDGKGYIESDGHKYRVEKGDFYMVNNSVAHSYYSDRDEPFSKIWINLYGSFIDRMVDAFGFPAILIVRVDAEEDIRRIHSVLEGKNAYEVRKMDEELSAEILHLLYKVNSARERANDSESTFKQIENYVHLHITDGVTVEEICEEFFISKSTLYRMFKKEVELSPTEYIKREKVRIARRILKRTTIEMSEIMRQLGFYDYSHFSRVFRSIEGESPVSYRKRHHEKS